MSSPGHTATSVGQAPADPITETAAPAPARRLASIGAEVLLLAGWAAIGTGAATTNGMYSSKAVVLVTAGTSLFVFCTARRSVPARRWSRTAIVVAGAAVLLGFHDAAGIYGSGAALTVSRSITSVVTVVVAAWMIFDLPRRGLVAYGAIALLTASGVAMVISSPRPVIDVWTMLQTAGQGLSHGQNMYTIRWTVRGSFEQTNSFTYLPGSAVLLWPFHALFGDVRYGLLAVMAGTAVVLARVRAGSSLIFLGVFVMLYPKTMFGLEQSWVDPLVLGAVCATAYAVIRGRTGWAVVAFAVCLACKQQAWLLLPLAMFWKDFGWRRAARSAAGAVAFIAPWVLTAPVAFYRGAMAYNLFLRPRPDSLSLVTTTLRHGWSPGYGVLAAATVGAMALSVWRLPHDTYGFLLGSGVVMAVFNLTNKQSFFNEWGLAAGLVLAALVFAPGSDAPPGVVSGSPQVEVVRS